ncbi:MAG: hypothetical protein LBM41_05990 [Ruminococcus sp.]|nr:hypothetical protein [Ruminococcus sp.]
MAKKNLKMTSFKNKGDNRPESKRKTHMRILTFFIALVVILGLVLIFPFSQ